MLLSPYSIIFQAIKARIAAELPDDFNYIDMELGQMEAYDYNNGGKPQIDFDGLLVDYENFNFKENGDGSQTAFGTILLRACFQELNPTSNIAPEAIQEAGLSYLEKELRLHKALHDWSLGEFYTPLIRVGATTESRPDNYRVRQLRYSISYQDDSTKIAVPKHQVTPTFKYMIGVKLPEE